VLVRLVELLNEGLHVDAHAATFFTVSISMMSRFFLVTP
jgi:hypothetical protein